MKQMKRGILVAASAGALMFAGQAWAVGAGSGAGGAGAAPGGSAASPGASPNGTGAGVSTGPETNAGSGEYKATEGRVENVNKKDNTISLAGSSQDLRLSPSTTIVKDGINTDLGSIKPGDDVRAVFLEGSPIHPYKIEAYSPSPGSAASSSGTGSSSSTSSAPPAAGPGSSMQSGIGPPRE